MKMMKRMAALLLTLCLLVGLPISVQAVGSSAPESFRILKVVEMPDSMASGFKTTTYPESSIKGKTVLVYFNSNLSEDNLSALANMKIRIQPLDANGDFVSGDGTLNYVSGTNPIALCSGTDIDTWRAKGATIHVNLTEGTASGSAKANKISDVYKNEAGQYLDYYADDVTYNTSYGEAVLSMAIGQETDMLTMIAAEKTGETTVNAYFSEPIMINASDVNTKYTAWLSIMDANNSLVRSNTNTYDGSVNTETTTNGKAIYQWQMTSMALSADGRTMEMTTMSSRMTNAFKMWDALTANYPDAGYSLKLRIEETSRDASLGEVASNYFIDAIWGKDSNAPLHVNCTSKDRAIVDMAGEALAATQVDDKTVKVTFSQAVSKGTGTSAVTVGGQAVTAIEPVGTAPTTQYLLTVADGVDISALAVSVVIPVGAFAKIKASTITLDTAEDTSAAEIVLKETPYNFMNADTGRVLAVDGTDELTLAEEGHNLYSFMIGEQYVDLTGTEPALSTYKNVYGLRACDNGRYQIVVGNGVLADTDEGESNTASLALKAGTSTSITTGWYLTEQGGQRPMKVLPFGDSITQGYDTRNADGSLNIGWRDTVSEELMTYLNDRVVFVGPKKNIDTTLSDDALARHAGYAGWYVQDVYNETPSQGLAQLTDSIKAKYAPDVTLLMVGTNDLGYYQNNDDKVLDDDELSALMTRYEDLVTSIAPNLTENGAVFASKLTPRQEEAKEANVIRFNALLETSVKSLQEDGWAVYLNDNHTGFPTEGENHGWRESEYEAGTGLHMNDIGDAFVTSRYVGMVKLYYGQDGVKKLAKITAQISGMPYASLADALDAAEQDDEVDLLDNVSVEDQVFVLDAGVTLDLNGYKLTANNVMAFGDIIDSTEGNGTLVVTQDSYTILAEDNEDMPLYDTSKGGYRFFSYTESKLGQKSVTDAEGNVTGIKFGIQFAFTNADAYTLMADTANARQVTVNLVAVKDGKTQDFDYYIQSSTLAAYAAAVANPEYENPAIILTVSGINGLTSLSGTPRFVSPTGMVYTGATGTYTVVAE